MDESTIYPATPANVDFFAETPARPSVIKSPRLSPARSETSTGNLTPENNGENQDGCRGSPPPNCAICLSRCTNKCFTDSCLHQFCFTCLLQWSKVKPVCPLCKQSFKSIIHNVRSNNDYEEYLVVDPPHLPEVHEMHLPSLASYAAQRFRYREEMALQNYLLDHTLTNSLYSELVADTHSHLRHTGRGSTGDFRASVYRYNLWAKPLPDITGRFRDCSPSFFRMNPSTTLRLMPWLNRELNILLTANANHSNYVVNVVVEILPRFHILSQQFHSTVHPFCGNNTEHFQHEFYEFARSPFDMVGYDRDVEYVSHETILQSRHQVISSNTESDDDSDVRIVSPDHNYDGGRSNIRRESNNDDSVVFVREEPGPSSSLSMPGTSSGFFRHCGGQEFLVPIETILHSSTDSDSDACVVVGYLKPPEERTPELITLNSSDTDSDVIIDNIDIPSPVIEVVIPRRPIEISTWTSSADDDVSNSSGSLYEPDEKLQTDIKMKKKVKKCVKKRPKKKIRPITPRSCSSESRSLEESVSTSNSDPTVVEEALKEMFGNSESSDDVFKSSTSSTTGGSRRSGPSEFPTNEHSKSKGKTKKSNIANIRKGKTLQNTNSNIKTKKNKKRKVCSLVCSDSDAFSDVNADIEPKKLKSVVIKTIPMDTNLQTIDNNCSVFSDNTQYEYNVGPSYYNSPVAQPKPSPDEQSPLDLTTENETILQFELDTQHYNFNSLTDDSNSLL